jgi:hypothetical protein
MFHLPRYRYHVYICLIAIGAAFSISYLCPKHNQISRALESCIVDVGSLVQLMPSNKPPRDTMRWARPSPTRYESTII